MFIILNYLGKIKKIRKSLWINFIIEKNEILKKEIISCLTEENNKEQISDKIIIVTKNNKEINENSNIQIIIKNKNDEEVSNLLDELIKDHKEQGSLKKIESLEQKLINNLDENSYSELIRLKNQLNKQ